MVRIFSTELNQTNWTNMYEIKSRRRLQILTFLVLFSKNSRFHWNRQPLGKNVIVEEVLDDIDIDDIGNLEDSPGFALIDEECENLIAVIDVWELTRNINQKKKSEDLQLDAHYLTNAVGECISPITMWNIVNQLGYHDFSCVSEVNNLKDRNFFLIKCVEIALTQF